MTDRQAEIGRELFLSHGWSLDEVALFFSPVRDDRPRLHEADVLRAWTKLSQAALRHQREIEREARKVADGALP